MAVEGLHVQPWIRTECCDSCNHGDRHSALHSKDSLNNFFNEIFNYEFSEADFSILNEFSDSWRSEVSYFNCDLSDVGMGLGDS
jgi:hypothetical protein